MKFITVEDGQFVLRSGHLVKKKQDESEMLSNGMDMRWFVSRREQFDVVEQAPPRPIKLARMVKPLPTLKVPIGRTAYLGHKGEEEMTEHFFEDLYKELPYLKDAPQDEVLALYKAGLLNVWEDTDGEW